MEKPTGTVNRTLVGCIAAALLTAAVVLTLWSGATASGAGATWRGACTRVGIVMAAAWLALPSRNRPAAWANLNAASVAAACVAVLALTKIPFRLLVPMAAALFVLGVLLRPRGPQRPRTRAQ